MPETLVLSWALLVHRWLFLHLQNRSQNPGPQQGKQLSLASATATLMLTDMQQLLAPTRSASGLNRWPSAVGPCVMCGEGGVYIHIEVCAGELANIVHLSDPWRARCLPGVFVARWAICVRPILPAALKECCRPAHSRLMGSGARRGIKVQPEKKGGGCFQPHGGWRVLATSHGLFSAPLGEGSV